MLLQTHDAIVLNIVTLLQHLFCFDMHLLVAAGMIKECLFSDKEEQWVGQNKKKKYRLIHYLDIIPYLWQLRHIFSPHDCPASELRLFGFTCDASCN